jgi:parallel beta-helix repeat protein
MKQKQGMAKTFALTIVWLMALLVFSAQTGKAVKTIIVPDNYPTITAAVEHAAQGDTVQVQSGVYYENVIVNKGISISGENSKNTVIIGTGGVERGGQAVFTLTADDIKLSGFTIESLNYSSSTYYASGIFVEGDNCEITDNNIRNNFIGIFCSTQSAAIISQNTIAANFKDGIRFLGGSLNKISENNIIDNAQSGIAISGYSNTISRNNIIDN